MSKSIITAGGGASNIISEFRPPLDNEGKLGDLFINRDEGYLYIKTTYNNIYKQLDYIEASGSAYINTGHKYTNHSQLEISYNQKSTSNSLWGSFQGGAPWTYLFYSGQYYLGSSSFGSIFSNGNHIFKSSLNGQNYTYQIDSNTQKSGTCSGAIDVNNTFKLFASGNSGGYPGYGQIKYCKMWDNDILVRNFIPVQRISDSVGGMFDLVNNVFYPSANSTKFINGTIISDQSLLQKEYWKQIV